MNKIGALCVYDDYVSSVRLSTFRCVIVVVVGVAKVLTQKRARKVKRKRHFVTQEKQMVPKDREHFTRVKPKRIQLQSV